MSVVRPCRRFSTSRRTVDVDGVIHDAYAPFPKHPSCHPKDGAIGAWGIELSIFRHFGVIDVGHGAECNVGWYSVTTSACSSLMKRRPITEVQDKGGSSSTPPDQTLEDVIAPMETCQAFSTDALRSVYISRRIGTIHDAIAPFPMHKWYPTLVGTSCDSAGHHIIEQNLS